MVKKLFCLKHLLLLITMLYLPSQAQITINKPVLGFNEACASALFNTFNLNFTISPITNLQATNVFKVELSDATGSFANPTQLVTTMANTATITVLFQFPTTINGSGYKIRVKSSAPAAISPNSDVFPALYKAFEQGFKINNEITSQSYCENGTYVLAITPDGLGNTPTTFPQLTYLWFKNNGVIAGENASTLTVNSPGVYYCKVNYGNCPSNAQSNTVTMAAVPAEVLTISSASTSLCNQTSIALTSSITGSSNVYQWYKDNQPIANSNTAVFAAAFPGTYTLKILNNACATLSNPIVITADNFTLSLSSGPTLTILPGQNASLNGTTNALSPTYSWFQNNNLLPGENQNFYIANQIGTYKFVVNQTVGCVSQKDVSTTIKYPTDYTLAINYSGSYTECESTTASLTVSSFLGDNVLNVATSGITIIYKWYKNGVLVPGATSNTLQITTYLENGIYTVKATLSDGTIVTSNELPVKLKLNINLQITSSSNYLCSANPSLVLTPSIQNNLYTYAWFKTGNTTSLSSSQIYSTTLEGDYYLKITYLGCDIISNTISIKKAEVALLTTDLGTEISINSGQSITITASGADSYRWSFAGQSDVTTTTFVINQIGTLTLVGTFGACTVEKVFTITENKGNLNTEIPNTITPNNDMINDTWVLPEEFAFKDNVEIVLFTSQQKVIFQTKNYLNDWPTNNVEENTVYYYKIIKDNSVLEKGTLSILK